MARVLVLDRSALVRVCLETWLVESGHQVVATGYGWNGLDHQGARPADIIFVGRYLTDMAGVDFLRLVRVKDPSTPAVMIRSADTGASLDGLGLGVVYVLEMPFDGRNVLEAIARATGSARVYGSDYVEPSFELTQDGPDALPDSGQSVA